MQGLGRLAGHDRQQNLGQMLAVFKNTVLNGRQRRVAVAARVAVAIAHDRDVGSHLEPTRATRRHGPNGHGIGGAQQGGGPVGQGQQLLRHRKATGLRQMALQDQALVHLQLGLLQGFQIALLPQLGKGVLGRAIEQGNAAVTKRDLALRRHKKRHLVVGVHPSVAAAVVAPAVGDKGFAVLKHQGHALVDQAGTHDHKSIKPAAAQKIFVHPALLLGRRGGRGGGHQAVAGWLQDAGGAAKQTRVHRVNELPALLRGGQHNANRARFARLQSACAGVWLVAQGLCAFHDPLPCGFGHIGVAIECAGDRRNRQAKILCQVNNRHGLNVNQSPAGSCGL